MNVWKGLLAYKYPPYSYKEGGSWLFSEISQLKLSKKRTKTLKKRIPVTGTQPSPPSRLLSIIAQPKHT